MSSLHVKKTRNFTFTFTVFTVFCSLTFGERARARASQMSRMVIVLRSIFLRKKAVKTVPSRATRIASPRAEFGQTQPVNRDDRDAIIFLLTDFFENRKSFAEWLVIAPPGGLPVIDATFSRIITTQQ